MSDRQRVGFWLLAALAIVILLAGLTISAPPPSSRVVPGLLFCALIVFTTTFGVPLAGWRVSLLPMTTVAGFLVMGPVSAGWAAFAGALVHGWIRHHWAEQLGERQEMGLLPAAALASANATIQVVSILVGGWFFFRSGGLAPLPAAGLGRIWPLISLSLAYLGTNLLLMGLYFALRGQGWLRAYLRSLPNLVLFEGGSLFLAPLMAFTYAELGLGQFILLVLAIAVASLVTRNLDLARQRLERRVKELDSLQALGQALSASLDLETILTAIHTQVARLMPAHNLYVALYDTETDEVSFPLVIEDGARTHWRSRQAGNGLTEYVLRARKPLLICRDFASTLAKLGLDEIGRPAASWLGVPILAGTDPLGVIAVQSYSPDQRYDLSHQDVLVTIAAQAAVVIQNARLYAQTDKALARRVQELGSILRTTREGILLLDLDYRVLTANRALVDFLGVPQLEFSGETVFTPRPQGEPPLATLIGYTLEELQIHCRALLEGQEGFTKQEIVIPRPSGRHVERTLAPVHGREGEITGWLLVLRDLTEERELARLREELTDMLIHDLRSPLTVVKSGLEIMEADLAEGNTELLPELVSLAQQSSDHMLNLINNLLDISRLESGQMSVSPMPLVVEPLMQEVATRLMPLAIRAHITLEVAVEPHLPPLSADPALLDRVLHNLLDNALKFTPDGGQVRMWARPDAGRPPQMGLIGVSDTGRGIPPERQGQLFSRPQKGISAGGRRIGSGLGLAFCKLVVEAHGGEIRVESEVGKGSTFVIRLPLAGTGG